MFMGYKIIGRIVEHEELGEYWTLGIAICFDSKPYDFIPDITCCLKAAKKLSDRLNRAGLSPIHIYDVLQDWLGSDECFE